MYQIGMAEIDGQCGWVGENLKVGVGIYIYIVGVLKHHFLHLNKVILLIVLFNMDK